MQTTVTRYHDFSYGHRILGDGPCSWLHGHNARVYVTISGEQNELGQIIDFADIKLYLFDWMEKVFNSKMILYYKDPFLIASDKEKTSDGLGLIAVNFHPSAENFANFLLLNFRSILFAKRPDLKIVSLKFEETRKCSVEVR